MAHGLINQLFGSTDRSAADVRRHAEEPAATGDLAGALERWRTAPHPHARIYIARYTALLGRAEEAARLLANEDWRQADREFLDAALSKLYVVGLGPAWIAAADALAERGRPPPVVYDRLVRAPFGELTEADRQRALSLFQRAPADAFAGLTLTAESKANAIVFLSAFAPPALAARVFDMLHADDDTVRAAWRRASSLAKSGALSQGDAQRVDDWLAALPDGLGAAHRFRKDVEARLATGELWHAELSWAQIADTAPASTSSDAARLARAANAFSLFMARTMAAKRNELGADLALDFANQLLDGGFRVEAARLLAPHVGASEKIARIYASAKDRGAPENRDSRACNAAYATFPSARTGRDLAAALAEELEYAAAEKLLLAVPKDAPRSEYWRALSAHYHRTGQYQRWADLLSQWRLHAPNDVWLAAEHLHHALSTGDRETITRAETEARTTGSGDPVIGRHLAPRLQTNGRHEEAVELWADVKTRTDAASDHFHYIQALFHAGRFDDGCAALEAAAARFPGDYRFQLKLAQAHERRNAYDRALENFAAGFALEPFNVDSSAGVARCLTYLSRHDEAEAWLARFAANHIGQGWVHAARAFNEARRGDRNAADAALGQLYGQVSAFMSDLQERQGADPAIVWRGDRFVSHPARDAGRIGAAFAADMAAMKEASSLVLVGNAPSLIGAGRGKAIDDCGFVVRLNDFQTAGFEADVGARTDLWYSSANMLARPNCGGGEERIWLSQPYAAHYPEMPAFANARLGVPLTLETARFLPPHIHVLSARIIYPRPTSGFRLITLLDFFLQRDYHLVGFSFFRDGDMHYFDKGQDRLQVGEVHAVDFERDFVHDVLAQARHLRWL